VKNPRQLALQIALSLLATLVVCAITQAPPSPVAPTYKITPVLSTIAFHVKASISIEGTFETWNATLAFASPEASTGSLDIKIRADSVNTGSKSKDKKLKGDKCFDVKQYPYITFQSTKVEQTGPHVYNVPGTFIVRGISKAESLTFNADREGSGEIKGTLDFDRRDFGLGGSIPFVRIADSVELTIDFKATRISGPPLLFKQ